MTKLTNLQESPQYIDSVLKMIEKALGYEKNQSFKVDFYPLFNERNFKNCHILIEGEVIIGHIGCLTKNIELLSHHPINMYGGIAIAEEFRGKGYFRDFFEEVQKKSPEASLSFLWSDQLDLYEKFNFYPCVDLFHYHMTDTPAKGLWQKTKLKEITQPELKTLKRLYQDNEELRPVRTDQDWQDLTEIASSDLFILKSETGIENYFFINKGQDLPNIIHEYGHVDDRVIEDLTTFGHLWTPFKSEKEFEKQELFGSVVKLGSIDRLAPLLSELAGVELITLEGEEISVKMDDEEFTLLQKDFLPGLLGPGKFKEFDTQDLFISGLDSI